MFWRMFKEVDQTERLPCSAICNAMSAPNQLRVDGSRPEIAEARRMLRNYANLGNITGYNLGPAKPPILRPLPLSDK